MPLTASAGRNQTFAAALAGLGMAATVGAALAFEHFGGYIPCKLCLEQRLPYYVGVPVMVLALASATFRLPGIVVRGLLAGGGLVMLWSLWLGAVHAGVEWGFWPGPADCGAVAGGEGGASLLDQLDSAVPPACDEAAGRFLGLSFAGWNVVASAILAAIALRGAFIRRKP